MGMCLGRLHAEEKKLDMRPRVQSAARVQIVPTFQLQPIVPSVQMETKKTISHRGLVISEKGSLVIFLIQIWMCIFMPVRIKIRFQEGSINFELEMKLLISTDVRLVICISGSQQYCQAFWASHCGKHLRFSVEFLI